MLHLAEQRRKQMEHELEMSAAQINKQRLIIRQLEKDKDRYLMFLSVNRHHPKVGEGLGQVLLRGKGACLQSRTKTGVVRTNGLVESCNAKKGL